MKDDIYIQLLREAKEQLKSEGITWDDFKKRIQSAGLYQNRFRLYERIYDVHASDLDRVHMGIEAYIWLLQYEEFHHALEESKQARKEAKKAMYFAGGAIVIQVLLWGIDKLIQFCNNP